ncbi:GAF and ANTAR domain-containing protein [Streptomyces sp. NPDC007100]|uniref:GAF and ANTAR domain-containing protein n=1 Tax=unclassified Streptomyces TaxID=2593676 RepID=UPI0033F7211E
MISMVRELPAQAQVAVPEGLIGDFDTGELLHRLSAHCAELLGVDTAAVLLADAHGRLRTVATTGGDAGLPPPAEPPDLRSPYADCYRSGAPETDIALLDARTVERWPRFTGRARELGYVTAHALPMRLRSRVIGVLGLLSTTTARLGERDAAFARSLADLAAVTLVQQRSLERSHAESTQLRNALSSRVVIEQAKGMLAERWATTVDEAFEIFRSYARAHRRRLADLARQIVDGTLDSGLVKEYFLNRR